mgnify:CR=1 FL=1
MAIANFNLRQFQSLVKTKGLATPNRFEAFIVPPPALSQFTSLEYQELSLLCETIAIPPLTMTLSELKIFGPTYKRPKQLEYGGEGIPITFHLDQKMNGRKLLEDWFFSIVDSRSGLVDYPKNYYSTITLRQLDRVNNVVYEIELIDVIPRGLNITELDNQSQNMTLRMNVMMAFRKWTRNTRDLPDTMTEEVTRIPDLQTVPVVEKSEQGFPQGHPILK